MASSTTFIGWGETAWGQGSWGLDLTIVNPDGAEGSLTTGVVGGTGDANVVTLGTAATASVTAAVVSANAATWVSGVESEATVASAAVTANADAFVLGISQSAVVNDALVTAMAAIYPTQVATTIQSGQELITAGAVVDAASNEILGIITPVLVWGDVNSMQTPNWGDVSNAQTPNWTNLVA